MPPNCNFFSVFGSCTILHGVNIFTSRTLSFFTSTDFRGSGFNSTFLEELSCAGTSSRNVLQKIQHFLPRQEAQKFPNRNVLQQYVRYIYMYRYSCTATGSLPVPVVHFLRAFSVSTPVGAPVLHTSIVLEFPTSDDLYVNSMWGPNGHLGPTPNS